MTMLPEILNSEHGSSYRWFLFTIREVGGWLGDGLQ